MLRCIKTCFLIFSYIITFSIVGSAQFQLGQNINGESFNDRSGRVAMSADGKTVAIGAPANDGNGDSAGHVRVYEWSNNEWIQKGQDIDGEAEDDNSGISISMSANGSRVIVGAPENDGIGDFAGHARVFEFQNGEWIQLGEDIDAEAIHSLSGHSVSMSWDGNRVAIGAPWNSEIANNAGHVRIYQLQNSEWIQLGQDIDGEAEWEEFGNMVSLTADGNRVAIGTHHDFGLFNNTEHVRIFELQNNEWIQIGQTIEGEDVEDEFGFSFSMSAEGNRIAIGARSNDGNGEDSGHVRIFEFQNDEWIQLGQDIDGEDPQDESGYSVSLSADGNCVAIGAPKNDNNGTNVGHVRIFRFQNGEWIQILQNIEGVDVADQSGRSVSISAQGQHLAIGALFNDDSFSNSGHVRIFALFSFSILSNSPACAGMENGVVEINSSNLPNNLTYQIFNDIATPITEGVFTSDTFTIENIAAGNYTFHIIDENLNIEYIDTFVVEALSDEILAVDILVDHITQNELGAITLNPNGGLPPYSYNWDTGDTTAVISNLQLGTYTVTITDANDCQIIEEIIVESMVSNHNLNQSTFKIYPNPVRESINVFLEENLNGYQLALLNTNGQVVLSNFIEPGNEDLQFNLDEHQIPAGVYILFLTDMEGCRSSILLVN